jgi:hypothetical protein
VLFQHCPPGLLAMFDCFVTEPGAIPTAFDACGKNALCPAPPLLSVIHAQGMRRPTPPRAALHQRACSCCREGSRASHSPSPCASRRASGVQLTSNLHMREPCLLDIYTITLAAYVPATLSWPDFVPTSNRPEGIKYRRAASRTPTNSPQKNTSYISSNPCKLKTPKNYLHCN